MDWKQEYKQKLVTPQEAVSHIKSGDRVVLGLAVGEPKIFAQAMADNKENYKDVEIITTITLGTNAFCDPDLAGHVKVTSLFVAPCYRDMVNSAQADFASVFLHEIPDVLANEMKVDVALVQLSSPDKHGYCSLGTSVDFTKSAIDTAPLVIAQINENMPRTMGDSFVHISQLDYICEYNEPLLQLPSPPMGDVELAIGKHISELIKDGDTLQLGIGAIPNAVLSCLGDKKDLGIHSEMVSDGVVDLMQSGVINNTKKTLHRGKSVISFIMGTDKIYEYIDDNPSIEMYPVEYVNNPVVIMQNDNMVSINSCLQVDLFGQVVSDSIGNLQFSGVGGQVDFVRGARMSRGGRSIMAMPATAGKGKFSRIVDTITEGSAVTTTRNDVDYIVTEYGVAQLHGKTLRQRARALINITHPDFRKKLIEAYETRFKEEF